MENMILYHTGFLEIPEPDVHYGRKNADFGQGFYTTQDAEFAVRWAKERKGRSTIINTYELDPQGLVIRRFARDKAWAEYITRNRAGLADLFPEADVIIGPIANDTIFRTFGIFTSGLLEPEQVVVLLQLGPVYEQIALKTERAARALSWKTARVLDPEELKTYRETLRQEEAAYQQIIAENMEEL